MSGDIVGSENENLEFLKFFRNSTILGIQQHTKVKDFRIEEIQAIDFYLRHWMIWSQLVSGDFRLVFKVFFDQGDVENFILNRLNFAKGDFGTLEYLREFSNLTLGLVKSCMEQNKVTLGMSVPILMRGFDELFFEDDLKGKICSRWYLVNADLKFACSVEYDKALEEKKLDYNLASKHGSGEIDLF